MPSPPCASSLPHTVLHALCLVEHATYHANAGVGRTDDHYCSWQRDARRKPGVRELRVRFTRDAFGSAIPSSQPHYGQAAAPTEMDLKPGAAGATALKTRRSSAELLASHVHSGGLPRRE